MISVDSVHRPMKCPKCGYDNPDGTVFCEECDWKLNLAYKGESMAVNSVYLAIASVVLGIAAIATAFLHIGIAAIICGALGMFLGGYTQSLVRLTGIQGDVRQKLMIMASVGLVLAVIGFIYGISVAFA